MTSLHPLWHLKSGGMTSYVKSDWMFHFSRTSLWPCKGLNATVHPPQYTKQRQQNGWVVLVPEAKNAFSSFHEIVEGGRRPLNGVDVSLHSVLQGGALSTLQLHVTVTGNAQGYTCYNGPVHHTQACRCCWGNLLKETSMAVVFGIFLPLLFLLVLPLVPLHVVLPVLLPLPGLIHHLLPFQLHLFRGKLSTSERKTRG